MFKQVDETPYRREPGYAERYRDRRFHSGHGPGTDRRERRALRQLLAIATWRPGPWLDMPSGTGRMSQALPGAAVQVDRDQAMLRACPGAFRRVCASGSALPFANAVFAGALCLRLLQHIPSATERLHLLAELARVTDGPVIVSFFDAWSLQHARRWLRRQLGKTVSGRGAVCRQRLLREMRAAGLRPLRVVALRRFFAEQTLVLCERG